MGQSSSSSSSSHPPPPRQTNHYAQPPPTPTDYFYHPHPPPPPPVFQPPPRVYHEETKIVRNDVNVHKHSLRIEADDDCPDRCLLSFVFDATVHGSLTILYFAKEGTNCTFSSIYPELCKPLAARFEKGAGQKFRQPSGSGIDLGFFELDELSKPLQGDIFPLVICAEAEEPPKCCQITQAVIEKNGDGPFKVKVIRQILWINGQRYELQDIFGLQSSLEESFDEHDGGKECVICLSEPRDTAVLPCRHMCMCGECAKTLTIQSNKCPVCRQPVEKLIEIKVKNGGDC